MEKILRFVIFKIKTFISVLILEYILGWEINNLIDPSLSSSKKHIVIYAHTSFYEHLIGYLLSLRYQIPLIFLVENELKKDPITSKILKMMDLIYIDRKKDSDIITYIASELIKYNDHIFAISIDSAHKQQEQEQEQEEEQQEQYNQNESKHILPMHFLQKQSQEHQLQGFYQIAMKTESMIYQIIFDFENQILKIENIQNYSLNTLHSMGYNEMIAKIFDGFKKEIPYYPDKILHGQRKTSIFNSYRSTLIYIPPFFVVYVLFSLFF